MEEAHPGVHGAGCQGMDKVEEKGYGLRFASESIFSSLKQKFGGILSSKKPEA